VEKLYARMMESPQPAALEFPPPVKLIALVDEEPSARDAGLARENGIFGFSNEGTAAFAFSDQSDYEALLRRLVLRALSAKRAGDASVVVDPGGALTDERFLTATRTAAREGIREYYASPGLALKARTIDDMLRSV